MGGYLSEADYDVIPTEWFTYTSKILDLATADGKEIKVELISPEIWLDRQGQHFTDTDKASVIAACAEFVKRFDRYPEDLMELADAQAPEAVAA